MTREEAIRLLSGLMFKGKLKEALDMAIKALEQEPTTKNDLGVDAISREQAINEFCIYNSYDSIGVDKVRSYLKALPSVTPQEPRKGHWIDTGWINECSCCHEKSFPFDDCGYGSIYHNFCPNCGADMRGEEV